MENVSSSWHNQVVMKLAVRQLQRSDQELYNGGVLSDLLGVSGKVVILRFRGARIRVFAAENPEGQHARSAVAEPVTDPLHLELLSGLGEAPDWPRPVFLHAIIETRSDPVLAVQRASRWASYSPRVAVVPQVRLSERALLEAQLRGVWVVAASAPGKFHVALAGERAPAAGSVRGLAHRLLDELVWEALSEQRRPSNLVVRSAATK